MHHFGSVLQCLAVRFLDDVRERGSSCPFSLAFERDVDNHLCYNAGVELHENSFSPFGSSREFSTMDFRALLSPAIG